MGLLLCPSCAASPHQGSRLRPAVASFSQRTKGVQRSHCAWGMTWWLQAASSLGFTWQSHDLIPNTEHSAAHQTRPLKRTQGCKPPEQWLPAFAWNDPTISLKHWCVQFRCSQNKGAICLVTSSPRDTTMTHLAALEVPVQIPINMKTHSKRRISEDYMPVSTSPRNNLLFSWFVQFKGA